MKPDFMVRPRFGFKRFKAVIFILTALVLINCGKQTHSKQSLEDVILNDSASFFYLDAANYPSQRQSLPIGIFDSGTGGLTVLNAIINYDGHDNQTRQADPDGDDKADFHNESFVYLGDQANMPYGNYPDAGKVELLKEHILKDVQFLLEKKYYKSADDTDYQRDKEQIKAVVIACNTATAYGETDIENFIRKAELNMPVLGVITAGVKGALDQLPPKGNSGIGVMATEGTVASMGYPDEIEKQVTAYPLSGEIDSFQQAGIGLAGAIDGVADYIKTGAVSARNEYKGPSLTNPKAPIRMEILDRYQFVWSDHQILYSGNRNDPDEIQLNSIENYISYHLVSLLEQIKAADKPSPLKAVILGCTHYPFYEDVFSDKLDRLYNYRENGEYIYRDIMSPDIVMVDPAENTAHELFEFLRDHSLFNSGEKRESRFFVSVPNLLNHNIELDTLGGFTYAYKYGREAGNIQEYVKRVPFSRKSVQPEVIQRIKEKMPRLFRMISGFNSSME
jgi:glutamate racemase